jgi:hypothetical protein
MPDPETQERRRVQRRRLARTARLPLLSGKVSALVLVACFALTAVLIPMALQKKHKPWPIDSRAQRM